MEISDNAITKSTLLHRDLRVKSSELPEISENISISKLSPEFKKHLKNNAFKIISLPPNSRIEIKHENDASELIIANPDFTLSFLFTKFRYEWENGIEPSHPEVKEIDLEDLASKFAHVPLLVHYQATFNFPETNFELFKNFYDFSQTIKKILERDWDYEKFKAKLPDPLFYKINHKINKLLRSS